MSNEESSARELAVVPASAKIIEEVWKERWGLPVVTVARQYVPADVTGLVLQTRGSDLRGLVTWNIRGNEAELVTLDSMIEGKGHGSRLLAAAEEAASREGVARILLVTTNDNLRAFGFYLRRGYRLVRVHPDAMQRVRAAKPGVPAQGKDGIPLQDMWELEKCLQPGVRPARRRLISSASPYESRIGFSRAVRVGQLVAVSGTAPIGDDGGTVAVGDLYGQTRRCIEVVRRALEEAGTGLGDVIRTRILLTSAGMDQWQEAARAHGEAFGEIRPATTFVQVAGFLDPKWLVEIEVDAVAADASPSGPGDRAPT